MVYSTKTTAIIEHIIYDEIDEHYGAEPEYPWNDWKAVLRRNDNNKWYGVVLKVSADKLGASEAADIDLGLPFVEKRRVFEGGKSNGRRST